MVNLPKIPYLQLGFKLISEEEAHLPVFKGSLLRGGFGNALRKTVCAMKPTQRCSECFLNRQCIHTKIFETLIFEDPPPFLKGLQTAPRPFILYCADERSTLKPRDSLNFELCLIGTAIPLPFLYHFCDSTDGAVGVRIETP